MSKPLSQITVVSENQQPCTIGVEAAHWIKASTGAHKVENRLAAARIADRSDNSYRLVQQKIVMILARLNGAAIHLDPINTRPDHVSRLQGQLSIHSDSALAHELFSLPSRSYAGASEETLKPFCFYGVVRSFRRLRHERS